MTSASDEKWRPFNCFFSRVGLRTYQQLAGNCDEWHSYWGSINDCEFLTSPGRLYHKNKQGGNWPSVVTQQAQTTVDASFDDNILSLQNTQRNQLFISCFWWAWGRSLGGKYQKHEETTASCTITMRLVEFPSQYSISCWRPTFQRYLNHWILQISLREIHSLTIM